MQAFTLAGEGSLVDPSVLLIEPDSEVVRAVVDGLTQAGMQVAWAHDGATGMTLRTQLMPEIVLVGLGLPDVNSVILVRQLAQPRNCGVVVLAGPEDETARIASLEEGADDYLTKSASVQETVARVRAVHRRVNIGKGRSMPSDLDPALVVGPIRIHRQHRSVHTLDGRRVNLTAAEYNALETLVCADGAPVSRDRLSEAVFRRRWQPEDRSVDQLVFTLRQKLPRSEDGSVLIQSIRGAGYWIRGPEQPSRPRLEHAWSNKDYGVNPAPQHQSAAA